MRHGLIDEFRILVHPVVLGEGRPLFESSGVRMGLRLKGTRTFGSGVILLHYATDGA
jgi:dihydrofolate reductase